MIISTQGQVRIVRAPKGWQLVVNGWPHGKVARLAEGDELELQWNADVKPVETMVKVRRRVWRSWHVYQLSRMHGDTRKAAAKLAAHMLIRGKL